MGERGQRAVLWTVRVALIAAIASLLAAALLSLLVLIVRRDPDLPAWFEAAGVALLAFLAVVREGLDISLVLYAALQGAPASGLPNRSLTT